jgi:hypothetical protein
MIHRRDQFTKLIPWSDKLSVEIPKSWRPYR